MTEFGQEQAFGASAVFRVLSGLQVPTLASQLPRRERWVLLLLDGRRSVANLARLTQRSELDVALTLARFLQWGYIEPVTPSHIHASLHGTSTGVSSHFG